MNNLIANNLKLCLANLARAEVTGTESVSADSFVRDATPIAAPEDGVAAP